jgi:hypothetical protein
VRCGSKLEITNGASRARASVTGEDIVLPVIDCPMTMGRNYMLQVVEFCRMLLLNILVEFYHECTYG